jgi:hypothetical protein
MSNHFHLVVETPRANLVEGMKWLLRTYEFRQELLAQVDTPSGPSHYGEAVQEAETERAEREVMAELKRLGVDEAQLASRPKGDLQKVEIARVLRSRTTMSLGWIAKRLSMGSPGYLAWLLGPGPKRLAAAARKQDRR